eukprot:1963360-Pleurochrysis_carterae.AAC.1
MGAASAFGAPACAASIGDGEGEFEGGDEGAATPFAHARGSVAEYGGAEEGEVVDMEDVQPELQQRQPFELRSGRYFVAVSLEEAETLRALLHTQHMARQRRLLAAADAADADEGKGEEGGDGGGSGGGGGTAAAAAAAGGGGDGYGGGGSAGAAFALRVADIRFDASDGFPDPPEAQLFTARHCFRLFDAELNFSQEELRVALRALQDNPMELRRRWFEHVYRCRRREQRDWMTAPVGRLFSTVSEVHLKQEETIRQQIADCLRRSGMHPGAFFGEFDNDQDGSLSLPELRGGL